MSLLNDIREDLRIISLRERGDNSFVTQLKLLLFYDAIKILILYRIQKVAVKYHIVGLNTFIRIFMVVRFKADISVKTEIGHGTQIVHLGIVIGDNIKIGKNCRLHGFITLGSAKGETGIKIGDNVEIGAGARVLGPLTIGSNCFIGANAVVLKDVPDNSIAVGVPAKNRSIN